MPARPISARTIIQWLITLGLVSLVVAAVLAPPPGGGGSGPIQLHGGPRNVAGLTPDAQDAIDNAGGERVHLVAQFQRPLSPAEQRQLEQRHGIRVLAPVPENAYMISVPAPRSAGAFLEMASDDAALLAVDAVRPADRLSVSLGTPAAISVPRHAIARPMDIGMIEDEFGFEPIVSSPPPAPPDRIRDLLRLPERARVPVPEVEALPSADQREIRAYLVLYFFADVPFEDQAELLDAVGVGPPFRQNVERGEWRIVLPVDGISELLAEDAVRWLEAIPAPPADDLHQARAAAGFAGPPGAGTGTRIAQWETCRAYAAHPGLANRVEHRETLLSPRLGACGFPATDRRPSNAHATLVAGILAGAPVVGQSTPEGAPQAAYYGMASGARLVGYAVGAQGAGLYSTYADAARQGATIAHNSWGTRCEIFQDATVEPYTWQAGLFDRVSSGRDILGRDAAWPARMLVVTSAGNYGDEARIESLWGSARVSNSAKNALSVGNVNVVMQQTPLTQLTGLAAAPGWPHLSSGRGPTRDGRISPVLSAPGIRLDGALPGTQDKHGGIRSTYPLDDYKRAWGTSFSAPAVSGAAALVATAYRSACAAEAPPMALRALLVHTAVDLEDAAPLNSQWAVERLRADCGDYLSGSAGTESDLGDSALFPGPDFVFGFGLVRADAAVSFAEDSLFQRGIIDERGVMTYRLEVGADDLEQDGKLRVTLAWDDPPWPVGLPPSKYHGLLQNDLDLELVDPRGRRHLPWLLNAARPNQPARQQTLWPFDVLTGEQRDRRNTIEQVEVNASELLGTWTIRVRAERMLQPPQSFALVSRALSPPSACGALPASFEPLPYEARLSLPDNWLLVMAATVLAVLVLLALRRVIRMAPGFVSGIGQALLMLAVLAAAGFLAYRREWLALAAFLTAALVVAVWLQPEEAPEAEPESEGREPPPRN